MLIDPAWIALVALVAIRVGFAFGFSAWMAAALVPARIRMLWVLGLSAMLVAGLPPRSALPNVDRFFSAALTEAFTGAVLAFGVLTAFGAVLLAGRLIDLQIGFGIASVIDPSTRNSAPLLGTLLHFGAIAVFFAIDGHHLVLRGLAFSFEHVPPGTPLPNIDAAALVTQFGAMFSAALTLAAPVVFVLFLVDVAMAVVARTMPQVNVFIVSLPLKIMVGLSTLAVSARLLNAWFARWFEAMFGYWSRVLGA